MHVMSFNMRMNTERDGKNAWPQRLDRVCQVIQESDVSLIGAQEVLPDMLSDLQRRLPELTWTGDPRRANDEACVIGYRPDHLCLLNSTTFWLSETPNVVGSKSWDSNLPRICTQANFATTDHKQRISLFNTHLDHMSHEARVRGIRVILSAVRDFYLSALDATILLSGDFNDHPESATVMGVRLAIFDGNVRFASAYDLLENSRVGTTFHGFQGGVHGEPIDYLFSLGRHTFSTVRVVREQYGGGYPSDHYPVVAEIREIE